ncbi:MAG: Gfo/Idh/MocA family protein, partial [Chitinophagaceae bacterium]
SQYNAKAYSTIDSLLKHDIDIVSVCTPNGFHAEHVIKSLQAGKHVLCEEPLCITGAAAWQIIETEKFSGKKLFVVNSFRYNPVLQDLKRLIDERLLGDVYSFQLNCFWNCPASYYSEWRGKKFPGGGALYIEASYCINVLLWLLGDVIEVKGYISNTARKKMIEYEDTGTAALKMKNNILGTINWSANAFEKNENFELTILAEKGTVCLGGKYLNELKYQYGEKFLSLPIVDTENNSGLYQNSINNYKEVYTNLIKALQNEDHSSSSSFNGLKTVETIECIYKAVNQSLPA